MAKSTQRKRIFKGTEGGEWFFLFDSQKSLHMRPRGRDVLNFVTYMMRQVLFPKGGDRF